MHHYDNITLRQKDEQARVFRLAQREGLTLKAISLDSGLGYTTIQSYARGEAVMSIASLFRLCDVIPEELLSLLVPEGFVLLRAPEEIDHDELAEGMREWLAAKDRAHHPESPAGRDLSECEDRNLRNRASGLRVAG
jgi:transcriptional regulator with XRE-family HTH domain